MLQLSTWCWWKTLGFFLASRDTACYKWKLKWNLVAEGRKSWTDCMPFYSTHLIFLLIWAWCSLLCTFYISFPPFQAPIQDTSHCCFSLLPSKSCSTMISTVSSPSRTWQSPSPSFGPSWPLVPINGCSALCCSLHSCWGGWVFPTSGSIAALDVTGGSALSSLRAASEIKANVWVVLTAKVLTMGEYSSHSYCMCNQDIWLSE